MKSLFVALQSPGSRTWSPVARVSKQDDMYRLVYTRGAKDVEGFAGFGRMREFDTEYLSEQLFPLLRNRILPHSRPEYREYIEWLGLTEFEGDSLAELSRTGGLKATDSIELIPYPERTSQGEYQTYFFVRGIRYFRPEVEKAVAELRPGDQLYVMKDVQNSHDPTALLLRTNEPISLVGYAPRYYSEDFSKLLGAGSDVQSIRVTVEKNNNRAPLHYRLLCKISAPWPEFFLACDSDKFVELPTRRRNFSVSVGDTLRVSDAASSGDAKD